MSDDLFKTTQGMTELEKALERFLESSAAARQRLSDATWAELLKFKEKHPEITVDDIIAIHEEFLRDFDAKAAPLSGLQGRIKQTHRDMIDAALDAHNKRSKNQ